MNENKINILDILLIIVKGKIFIIIFTLLMSVIAVVYTLVVPERWSSQFTVFPIIDSNAMSLNIGLLEGLGMGSQTTARAINQKNATVLKSRTITEETIQKFNLIEYFNITEEDSLKAMEDAIKAFHSDLFYVLLNDEVFFMTVRITTKDKYFSQEIAQHYLDFLINYSHDNKNSIGRQRRELLEHRILEITEEMQFLAESLQHFQNEHNIVEITEQAKAAITTYGNVIQNMLEIEIELNYVQNQMPNSPMHRDLISRRNISLEAIRNLESGYDNLPFLLSMENINDKIFSVQEMIFRLELYQRILQTVYPQLELARIEEINNMDRFEIIDLPNLPGRRSFPKRAVICVMTFMISLVFSSSCVVVNSIVSDEDKSKINEIIKLIFKWKK